MSSIEQKLIVFFIDMYNIDPFTLNVLETVWIFFNNLKIYPHSNHLTSIRVLQIHTCNDAHCKHIAFINHSLKCIYCWKLRDKKIFCTHSIIRNFSSYNEKAFCLKEFINYKVFVSNQKNIHYCKRSLFFSKVYIKKIMAIISFCCYRDCINNKENIFKKFRKMSQLSQVQ